jgi:hypothetical protein
MWHDFFNACREALIPASYWQVARRLSEEAGVLLNVCDEEEPVQENYRDLRCLLTPALWSRLVVALSNKPWNLRRLEPLAYMELRFAVAPMGGEDHGELLLCVFEPGVGFRVQPYLFWYIKG